MLLHLLAQKDNTDSSGFDQKWNQLMPRRPPVIAKAGDGGATPYPATDGVSAKTNGVIQTIAEVAPTLTVPQDLPLRPPSSVDSRSTGTEPDLTELNASKLALAGSFQAEVPSQDAKSKPENSAQKEEKVTSPVNELSLEAELSALNATTTTSEDSDNDGSLVDGEQEYKKLEEDETERSKVMEISENGNEEESAAEPENQNVMNEDVVSPSQVEPTTTATTTTSIEDKLSSDLEFPSSNMPDIVATSTPTTAAPHNADTPDFMTSTPKKADCSEDDTFHTAAGSAQNSAMVTTPEVSVSEQQSYHTAYISQSRTVSTDRSLTVSTDRSLTVSTDRSLSFDYEDNSLLGEKNFANMLQTVALPSVDAEDAESSLASVSPLEKRDEEVFDDMVEKAADYRQITAQDGEVTITPDNGSRSATPTPGMEQESGVPLLEEAAAHDESATHERTSLNTVKDKDEGDNIAAQTETS